MLRRAAEGYTYHVKQLTADTTFYHYHVHLDARNAVNPLGVAELKRGGFKRSHVSVNCFTFAGMQSPNSILSEMMFEDTLPDTWTLKTSSREDALNAYDIGQQVMKRYGVEGYIEAEIVHSDRAVWRACHSFSEDAFNKLCPIVQDSDEVETFIDCSGQRRELPFVTLQRNLSPEIGERAPVMEFHLSVNYDMITNDNIAKLLHAMGLVSYEVEKLCALSCGNLLRDSKGVPILISERPLTLRLANPGRLERSGTNTQSKIAWKNQVLRFLNIANQFVEIVELLGGFEAPKKFDNGILLHPITFKLESLFGFYPQVSNIAHLPPVLDRVTTSKIQKQIPPQIKSIRSFSNYLEKRNTQVSLN